MKTCDPLECATSPEDGRTFFFDTHEVPAMTKDTDSQRDAYRYENGEVTLVSEAHWRGRRFPPGAHSSDEGCEPRRVRIPIS